MTMAWVGGAMVVGSLAGGYMQGQAAENAADTQAAASRYASQQQREMFDIQNRQFAPYRGMGYTGLNLLSQFLPGQTPRYDAEGNVIGTQQGSGFLTENFTPADIAKYGDPAYDFVRSQGLGAVTQRFGPAGGGSNRDIARTKFASDYAKLAYQQAFENKQSQQTNLYNRLAGIINIGTGAQTQVGNLASGTATNIGQLGMAGAAAQAAGTVGAANAYSGAINNITNAGMMYGMGKMGYLGTGGSDRRLKRDIEKIGKLDSGLNLYKFRYLDEDKYCFGVMSDEVREVFPDAVSDRGDGYDQVDYSKLV